MSFITSLVLAAFVAYAGAWFSGAVEGNFAFLLFIILQAMLQMLNCACTFKIKIIRDVLSVSVSD
jgi:hypothetical protein